MANTDTKSAEKPLPEGIPNRFVFVKRTDEEVKKTRVLEGQLLVCQGCCCGKTERGMPALPLDDFKQQWKERGIRLRVHLTITGCLGPCPLANVVLILFAASPFGCIRSTRPTMSRRSMIIWKRCWRRKNICRRMGCWRVVISTASFLMRPQATNG